jgi:hypothetical protein
MLKPTTAKLVTACAVIAVVAVNMALSNYFIAEAHAEAQNGPVIGRVLAKADRLPFLPRSPTCASSSWPNYEPGCLFDVRKSSIGTPAARIIAMR